MLFLTQFLRFTPEALREFLAKLFGTLWYIFAKGRREVIRENLLAVLGEAKEEDVKEVFINFMRVYGDILNIPNMSERYVKSMIKVPELYILKKELEKSRGLILVSCHLGGMELAGIFLSSLGFPLYSVAETRGPGMSFFNFYKRYRTKFGNKLLSLESKNLTFKLIKLLKENKIVVLIGDRDILNTGVPTKFFGRIVSIPKGIVLLSRITKAPILVGFLALNKFGSPRYIGKIFPPIYPEEFCSPLEMLDVLVKNLEEAIKMYPLQWFVFQRIWK
ncbi:MAG: lysophospholipid acyltransferase family protein [candidate division WOR-3 bacterium]